MQQYSRNRHGSPTRSYGAAETGHYYRTLGIWRAQATLSCGSKHRIRGEGKLYLKYISEPKHMIRWFSTELTQRCIISIILKRLFASPADNHMHFKTVLELLHITRNLLSKQLCKNHSLDFKNNTKMMVLRHTQKSTATVCKGLETCP